MEIERFDIEASNKIKAQWESFAGSYADISEQTTIQGYATLVLHT